MNLVAGLSSSLQDQLKQILEVVGTALKKVNRSLQESAKQKVTAERQTQTCREYEARVREAIRQGTWHDPRLDAIAGVGVISELGVGDEAFDELVVTSTDSMDAEGLEKRRASEDELSRKERTAEELYAIGSLPVVIIKNYAARGRTGRQEMQEVLGQWAATLVENQVVSSLQLRTTADHCIQIAQVIIISDNRENAKLLARGKDLVTFFRVVFITFVASITVQAIELRCPLGCRCTKLSFFRQKALARYLHYLRVDIKTD